MPGTVSIGDPFSGRLVYEVGPANPDQQPADPEVGAYDLVELVVDQSVLPAFAPSVIGVLHQPGLPTIPPVPPDLGRDWFFARATTVGVYPIVTLGLRGPFGSAFTDDSLPLALDLADFPDGAFVQGLVAAGIGGNPSIEDVGRITSLVLVPEPGTLALAVAGLSLVARARTRRA
jgi:hypothetical protein